VHLSDPELAVWIANGVRRWCGHVLLGAGVVAAVLLAMYPPFPAWLRLCWHRGRLALSTDRGPLLRAQSNLKHFESAQRHLEVGRLALQIGDLSTAVPHLQRAVEMEPSLAAARYQLGRLLFRVGALPQALDAFTRAESADPGHAFGDALLHAGRCLHLMGDDKNSIGVLRAHAQRHGGSRRSSYWLGEALRGAGDREGAAAAFAAAAAPPTQKLTAEENWFRALARVQRWRRGGP
jgi:tetratricopeptide (TPR) repeat protein